MIQKQELRTLLADLESDRVERTLSINDTNKFCEAICSFANDMPGHRQPGYLILGASDSKGTIEGIEVTDNLLQKLSNYADSGQIIPLPAIHVQKIVFPEGNLIVVEVLPSDMPPIRYRGRTWIRRGPRKAIANEQEERILTERRVHHAKSFDLRPCKGCGKNDLTLDLFQLTYRDVAVAPEIIEENRRDMLLQMASLGFWVSSENCATYAGAILFAQNPSIWIPGSMIQYVKYEGSVLDSEVLDERRFQGDLISMLRELDSFLKTLFSSKPVLISPLREEMQTPYPMFALRELLMNAVMHRDYASNAPVRLNWFSDRIEIQNPGGLYGAVTVKTFPNQTDYRNPKIAEAMKVLGYVNNFGRGINRVQGSLQKNGNPPATFKLSEPTYFLACLKKRVS